MAEKIRRMDTFTHRRIATLAAVAALMAVAACGGGDGTATAPAPAPAPSPGAPTATLTAPAAFTLGSHGQRRARRDRTDDVSVASVEFQIDGVPLSTTTTAPYAANVDTTQFASGQHVLRVRAIDGAGNASAWSSATVSFGGSRTQPAGFTRDPSWVTGLSGATAIAQTPDGRMFVTQQSGELRVVTAGGSLVSTPATTLAVDSSGERGLLGVAVHPSFASNGYIYLYYTTPDSGTHNRISRFTLINPTSNTVSAGSELVIADLPALSASATNHNGGALHFGTDGKLYVGVGDNATGANAQSLATRLGKMLRYNDDGTIPGDNPFMATTTGDNQAIWAMGLRNPFTFAVQPGTGTIYIDDVGQSTWEEIDLGTAGANYGWPGSEGPDDLTSGLTGPLFTYNHNAASPPGSGPGGFFTGIAIIGGAFYPDSGPFPAAYRGSYFFADLGSEFVARYDAVNNAAYSFGALDDAPVGMLTGLDGALYVLTQGGITRFSAP
jgi:glucose/arabinose dehydrogenase